MCVFSPHDEDLLYISYIEQRRKTAGKRGKGGQFSAKNRGRPLWKAPYMIINTKILCGLGIRRRRLWTAPYLIINSTI